MSKQRQEWNGTKWRRKQERNWRETCGLEEGGREGRSIIDGFVSGREQNKNAHHVVLFGHPCMISSQKGARAGQK